MTPAKCVGVEPIDTLSICVNASSTADMLAELAIFKRGMAKDHARVRRDPDPRRWADRLVRWADMEDHAAATIRGLVAEIERLRSGGKPS